MHDGETSHLVVSLRLREALVRSERVVWNALGNESLVEVVALRPVQSVHIDYFLTN